MIQQIASNHGPWGLIILALIALIAIGLSFATTAWTGGVSGTGSVPREDKTANYTVVAGQDQDKTFTTIGAGGTVTFSLPAATVGQRYRFLVGAAQELRIDPNGTETIALPSTGVQGAAGKYLTANAAGEFVVLECIVAGTWTAIMGSFVSGIWTAQG